MLMFYSRKIHYHPPTQPLRTEFIYNNYMYGLAGYIAELMADDNWQDIVSEMIFKPLNMTDSTFVNRININSEDLKMAKPYVHKDNETVEIDLTTLRYDLQTHIPRLIGISYSERIHSLKYTC